MTMRHPVFTPTAVEPERLDEITVGVPTCSRGW